MRTYADFYQTIDLPSFAPPSWVFGLAWGIIYPLIVIAGVYLLYAVVKKRLPVQLLIVFVVNIIANLLFTPLQLGLNSLWPASIDILVILGTLVWLQYHCWSRARIVFWLLLPYLLWGAFATVLQLTITLTN